MIKIAVAGAIAALSLVSDQAKAAEPQSVQSLLNDCEAPSPGANYEGNMYCLGVAAGISTVMQVNCRSREDGRDPMEAASMGEFPTLGALVQTFINWARASPERWGEPGVYGMMWAFTAAFPCEQE